MINPAFATDIGQGRFVASAVETVTDGLSIFRVRSSTDAEAALLRDQNRLYHAQSAGTAYGNVEAMTMVMANSNIRPPRTSEDFRSLIIGYHLLLLAVVGDNTTLVRSYRQGLVDPLNRIIHQIEQQFPDGPRRNHAFLLIMMFIHRITNAHLSSVLSTATLPTAAELNNRQGPSYDTIIDRLAYGTLDFITTLPPDLLTIQSPLQSASRGGGGGGGGGNPPGNPDGGGGPPGGQANQQRRRVELRNQNRNLKEAWAALNHASVFGGNSPFRDPSNPPRYRKEVVSDQPPQRVCLPMALTGVCYDNCRGKHGPLSAAEVQRVAACGEFTVRP